VRIGRGVSRIPLPCRIDGDDLIRFSSRKWRRVSYLDLRKLELYSNAGAGKGTTLWKVISFIFGFPGTLLTLLVITQGSERAYGIDMPRKSFSRQDQMNPR